MRLLFLLLLLPAAEPGTWDCTDEPLAQVVVEDSNAYSTILSWDFTSQTFKTLISQVTTSEGGNLKVNGCAFDSTSDYIFCFKSGSVELYKLGDDGVGTLQALSWDSAVVDCTIATDGQVVAAGAEGGHMFFNLAGAA